MASKSLAGGARKRHRRRKKRSVSITTRLLIVLTLLTVGFLGVVTRLIYLQIFDSSDQYAAQVDQLIDEVQITAERGNIYDRNMNVLVQDSSAKSVNLIPKSVEDPVGVSRKLAESLGEDYSKVYAIATQLEDDRVEITDNLSGHDYQTLLATLNNNEAYEVDRGSFYVRPIKVTNAEADANAIAAVFEMDPTDVMEYLTSKENTPQAVKTKVDNAQAEEIKNSLAVKDETGEITSYNGVELLEDKKRYYTNGNFASYILGFTGNAHEGLYGVEKTFDDTLSGTNGIVYYQKDANGNIIESQTKTIQEAKRGEDLVLSIDSNIQSASEKALEGAVKSWGAKSGTAITMNCKTGEIIAMASKPDYDLNNPYTISETFSDSHAEDLQGLSKAEQDEQMWKNPAVSFIYEPGSTFKPITVATALEEGAITPNMTVTCTGAITVGETVINCTGVHGTQTIPETLENSCNPGLVQIIQDLDPNVFYKYVYNFGFGQSTGIELTGEEDGIVNRVFNSDGDILMVDYSTFSFGQGLATTPIQILTALNSLINNGYYISPTLIKGGNTESPRQVISASTSGELREDMKGVLESKEPLLQRAGGFSMGGKTGTAEKFINGEYSSDRYVTSFFCFSPVDDPQYCTLLILDEPINGAAGATSAAPSAIEILKQAMIYNGSNPAQDSTASILIPECVGQELDSVKAVLDERGISYTVNEDNKGTIVLAQSIPAQTAYNEGDQLILTVGAKPEGETQVVPDFNGMTIQSVNEKIKELGIHLTIEGNGFAYEQSISPGTAVTPDMNITVKFRE